MWRFLAITWIASVPAWADPGIEVRFEFLRNQIFLRASIEGQGPYNFLLDTGTAASTIDAALARELQLPLGPPISVSGAGKERRTGRPTILSEIRLGDLVVRDLKSVAIDLSGVSRSLGRPLHGVLGFSFLKERVTQIDYFQRRIRFLSEPPRVAGGARAISFPMSFHANSVLPILRECYVNGNRLAVTLDTGSSMGLVLFPKTVQALGLSDLARRGIPLNATGYRGQARITKGWATSVRFASIDLGAIEVGYVQSGFGDNEEPDSRGGNVGNAVLQDFILTLDYPRQTITLELADQGAAE